MFSVLIRPLSIGVSGPDNFTFGRPRHLAVHRRAITLHWLVGEDHRLRSRWMSSLSS